MSAPILHIAKVAGISGSENHLLLLLPALRERGHDVRLVMLHEDEPGAAEFASRLREADVPVDELRLRSAASPIALARLTRLVRSHAPDIVHTHLVHADFLGLTAARLARVPVRASTKHGFNPFRDGRVFAAADRSREPARRAPHRDLRRARPIPRRARRARRGELRDRPLRDRPGTVRAGAAGTRRGSRSSAG